MKPAVRHVEFSIFLCILLLSLVALRPLVRSLENKLTTVRQIILTELERTYNIRISYESLSPSILRSIALRNVRIYDAERNTEIAGFEHFLIQYRFLSLLRGDIAEIMDSVNITNGFITIDLLENTMLADTIRPMLQESGSERSSVNGEYIRSFFSSQLLTVHLKNIRFTFKDAVHDLSAKISDGYCRIDSESLTVSLNSTASYQNGSYTELGRADTSFSIEGKFTKDLTTGSAVANVSHFSTGQFGIYHVKLFADYRDKLVTFNTMQDFQPIDFTARWNIGTNDINGVFSCKDFAPMQSVTLYKTPKNLEQFSAVTMTGSLRFAISEKKMHWDTDFTFSLPPLTFSSYRLASSKLRLEAEGNNRDITISRFSLSGKDIDLYSKCAFNLDTKRPSGSLAINSFKLPSGTDISADLHFFPQGNGTACKIRSLTAGGAVLSNVNITLNPAGKKLDYTLSAEDGYGKYSLDGSYIYNNTGTAAVSPHFLELHGAFDAVNVENIYQFIHAAFPNAGLPETALESLQCTTEFYISSDFHQFSYNCIRLVLVSNTFDNFYTLLSIKGNQSSFALTDIDISYKNMYVRGELNADFEHLNDIIFNSSLVVNAIGFQFQGFFSQNVLTVYGDYGLAISALYDQATGLKGTIKMGDMPLPVLPLFLTLDSEFQYNSQKDWNYKIYNGYLSYGSPVSVAARTALGMSFYGTADPSGLFLSEVKFGSDEALTGTIAVKTSWSDKDTPDEYKADINLVSPDATEKMKLAAHVSLSEVIRLNGSLELDNISLARFLYTQGKENRISAKADFLGSPDSLSVRFNMPQLSFFVQGNDLQVSEASFTLENENADLAVTKIGWGAHQMTGMTGNFSLAELGGTLNVDYAGEAVDKILKTHIHTAFTGTPPDNKERLDILSRLQYVKDRFTVTAHLTDWQFGNATGKEAVPISVIREKEVTAFYAGKNDDITGFVLDDGVVSLQCAKSLPVNFTLDGKIKKDILDLRLVDLYADVKWIWDITGLDYVRFYGGALTGNLTISGRPMEPEFNGKLEGRDITVNSPHYVPEVFGPVSLDILANGTVLEVPYTVLHGPSTNLWARCTAEFLGWIPEEVSIQCGTLGAKLGVVKTDNLLFKADGFGGCTIDINITPSLIGLYGSATFDAGYFALKLNEFDAFQAKYADMGDIAFDMKLDLQLGHKAEFRWPTSDIPLLRTLVPTEAPLTLIVDGNSETFSVKGNVKMRGGEVFYVKRTFYIREGNIAFTGTDQEIEPLITLRAEIRDRDDTGEPLRLILTAEDQPLSNFNPVLNSDPPRSSNEIMQLLGQALVGNTGKEDLLQNLLVSGSDVLAQIGFFKKSESSIRDFLGLDAFSFRTLLLQNTIFGNLFNTNKTTTLTMSNYLDNTSVYIGKYFGSAIYADALMHLSHYDSKLLKNSGTKRPVYNNLLFQPEIGLEMATPFFMLRGSVAPTNPDTLFVGDAALTFSWKYSY